MTKSPKLKAIPEIFIHDPRHAEGLPSEIDVKITLSDGLAMQLIKPCLEAMVDTAYLEFNYVNNRLVLEVSFHPGLSVFRIDVESDLGVYSNHLQVAECLRRIANNVEKNGDEEE